MRYCDGTAQDIAWANPVSTAVDNITMGIWVYYLSLMTDDDYLYFNGNASGTGYGMQYRQSTGTLQLLIAGDNWYLGVSMSTITWTSVILRRTSGTWQFFKDGAAVAGTTTAAPNTPTVETYFGGLPGNAAFSLEKRCGEVFFCESALSTGEIAAIGKHKYSPLAVCPGKLTAYVPCGGMLTADDADLDIITRETLTATGAGLGVADHPPIIYPTSPIVVNSSEAAAAGGGGPFQHYYQLGAGTL